MSRELLWDSGAVLALLDASDSNHKAALAAARLAAAERRASFITNYVEVETHALLLGRLGRSAARDWLLGASLPVVRATLDDENRAKDIVARHADKDFSLCDAISFAVMARRGALTAFSFDHHFRQYGRFTVLGLKK